MKSYWWHARLRWRRRNINRWRRRERCAVRRDIKELAETVHGTEAALALSVLLVKLDDRDRRGKAAA